MNDAVFAVAWYSEEEYSKFLLFSDDPNVWDQKYESWKSKAEDTIQMLEQEGARISKVPLKFEEVHQWCVLHGRQNVAESRSEFAASKLQGKSKSGT